MLLSLLNRSFTFPQVLKITLLGHRKRIIASLAERPYEEPPVKPPRLSQIRVRKDDFQLMIKSTSDMRHLTVSHHISAVPRPACIPDPVSPESDGGLHGALDGPSAACRRASEEESARK